jgi:hypothetical protein
MRIPVLMNVVFVETAAFSRVRKNYFPDDEYQRLQSRLIREPWAGAVMSGSGGLRKLRWRNQSRGKGTRGGYRIVYYWWQPGMQIWFLTAYDKDSLDDVSVKDRLLYKKIIEEMQRERK